MFITNITYSKGKQTKQTIQKLKLALNRKKVKAKNYN